MATSADDLVATYLRALSTSDAELGRACPPTRVLGVLADVTSVDVCNRIIRPDDVFEIDPSGSTHEAAGSAVGNNLVLASAFDL